MSDLFKTRITHALQAALAEATPPSNSGSHKIFVVGQIVVNVQSEDPTPDRCRGVQSGPCCGKCHK
jgi:hypothetical protein